MRTLASSLASLAALMLAGCIIGEGGAPPPTGGSNNNGTPDAHVAPATPPDATPPDAAPPPIACKNGQGTLLDGHHNPGLDCESGNCHGPGGSGPNWTVSGTLYKPGLQNLPLPYAIVTVVDAKGNSIDLITTLNGNFYSSAALTPPLKVYASKCPDLAPMVGAVQYGSCNACHSKGQTQGLMHLP